MRKITSGVTIIHANDKERAILHLERRGMWAAHFEKHDLVASLIDIDVKNGLYGVWLCHTEATDYPKAEGNVLPNDLELESPWEGEVPVCRRLCLYTEDVCWDPAPPLASIRVILELSAENQSMDELAVRYRGRFSDRLTVFRLVDVGGRRFVTAGMGRTRPPSIGGIPITYLEEALYQRLGTDLYRQDICGGSQTLIRSDNRQIKSYSISVAMCPSGDVLNKIAYRIALRKARSWAPHYGAIDLSVQIYRFGHLYMFGAHADFLPELLEHCDDHTSYCISLDALQTDIPREGDSLNSRYDACPMNLWIEQPNIARSKRDVFAWKNLYFSVTDSVRNRVYLDYLEADKINEGNEDERS